MTAKTLFLLYNREYLSICSDALEQGWLVMLFSCMVIMLWVLGIIPEYMTYRVIGISMDSDIISKYINRKGDD